MVLLHIQRIYQLQIVATTSLHELFGEVFVLDTDVGPDSSLCQQDMIQDMALCHLHGNLSLHSWLNQDLLPTPMTPGNQRQGKTITDQSDAAIVFSGENIHSFPFNSPFMAISFSPFPSGTLYNRNHSCIVSR